MPDLFEAKILASPPELIEHLTNSGINYNNLSTANIIRELPISEEGINWAFYIADLNEIKSELLSENSTLAKLEISDINAFNEPNHLHVCYIAKSNKYKENRSRFVRFNKDNPNDSYNYTAGLSETSIVALGKLAYLNQVNKQTYRSSKFYNDTITLQL